MIKREAKFTVLFRHWILAYPIYQCCAFELKQTTIDFIPWSAVKEHQVAGLITAKHGSRGLLYKLPDDSRGIKPFDMVWLKNSGAYVVIKFPKFFCLIDIDRFLDERAATKKKSITSSKAKEISSAVIDTQSLKTKPQGLFEKL